MYSHLVISVATSAPCWVLIGAEENTSSPRTTLLLLTLSSLPLFRCLAIPSRAPCAPRTTPPPLSVHRLPRPTDLVACLASTTTLEPVALMRWLDNSGLARGPLARLRPPRSTLVCFSLRPDHGPLARAGWRRVAGHILPEVCAGCRSRSWGSSTPWPTHYCCLGK